MRILDKAMGGKSVYMNGGQFSSSKSLALLPEKYNPEVAVNMWFVSGKKFF